MTTPLEPLIALAQRRCDAAATALAAQLKLQGVLQLRGATLEQYRGDYLRQLETVASAGIDAGALRNLRRFLARLDEAQAQQQSDAQACQARVAQTRAAWQAAQRRMKAFSALERRRDRALALVARRIEQGSQDEVAARVSRVRSAANQEDRP